MNQTMRNMAMKNSTRPYLLYPGELEDNRDQKKCLTGGEPVASPPFSIRSSQAAGIENSQTPLEAQLTVFSRSQFVSTPTGPEGKS
jgi:hypothetical protein